ncbi:MAG: alkaline phosphatase family protein [Acidobacteriota bacterium]|nr:alkaline phosphatase family protein [Blastocatellia bacterium]MDW8239999.1 alkaline phosphatase family protein [Acidobacteriota bacterium]
MKKMVSIVILMTAFVWASVAALQSAPKVLLIVWDGSEYSVVEPMFRNGQLPNLGRIAPTVHRLLADKTCETGPQECECITTETKPQFAIMLTGLLADATGVVTNRCFRTIPAGMTVPEKLEARDATIRTAHISGKSENPGTKVFQNLSRTVDYYLAEPLDSEQTADQAIGRITQWAGNSFFIMLHFREPDRTGHLRGVNSIDYQMRLLEVDRQTGRILDALAARGILNQTIIYVISDHGFGVPGGPVATRPFLHTNSPNAIFASNDPAGGEGVRMRDIASLVLAHWQ